MELGWKYNGFQSIKGLFYPSLPAPKLTHGRRDKMAAIFRTPFSGMKMHEFSIIISMKLVPKDLINNIPALNQIMAWRRPD